MAVILVGTFGLMWVGVVIYADQTSAFWMRITQVIFGFLLLGWAVQKAVVMISRGYSEADGWNR
ncbi:hypothetical protein [Nonomuraea solani]|uniref:hypothetical protein n=1 Tax=Nonomuraea solani TaxID=1144553 RepID=UPI001F2DC2B2|nr:hypothetical protein [Nonomuraea solani]